MSNFTQNVDISGTKFSARLVALRAQKNLSKTALAKEATLTYRTIHDLESGRRDRIQEKTLMLIAKALGVSSNDLLNGVDVAAGEPEISDMAPLVPKQSRKQVRPGRFAMLIALIFLVLLSASVIDRYSARYAQYSIDGATLTGAYGVFHTSSWEVDYGADILFCRLSPWDEKQLLIGLSDVSRSGGRFICLNRANGKELWQVQPDGSLMIQAFGSDALYNGNFSCSRALPMDWDGDQKAEMLLQFDHGPGSPSCLCLVNDQGEILAQYASWGSIDEFLVVNWDNEPGEDVIVVGSNDAPQYMATTLFILSQNNFSGATVDAASFPKAQITDSSLLRIIIPHFPEPFHRAMGSGRMDASGLRIILEDNAEPCIQLTVMYENFCGSNLRFNSRLEIKESFLSDNMKNCFLKHCPKEYLDRSGPLVEQWRKQWLSQKITFISGQLISNAESGNSP